MGGHFQDTCKFDALSVVSAGLWDAFIAKYDVTGSILWLNYFGASLDDGNTVIRVDNKNNIYVAGIFANTVNIGGVSLISSGASDIFLAKCDSNGNFSWATQAGSDAIDIVNWGGMTIDPNGNMYVTGYYGDTASFGNITVPGYYDIFVTKYDSTGKCDWVKTAIGLGGIQSQVGNGIAEIRNNIYVIGSFQNDLTFVGSPLMLSSTGSQHDIYIAKISQTPTGINDLNVFTNPVAIYPNPAATTCTITAPSFLNSELFIYDITGRVLTQQKFNDQATINVSTLQTGIYVVEIKDKEGKSVKGKMLKEF